MLMASAQERMTQNGAFDPAGDHFPFCPALRARVFHFALAPRAEGG